MRVGSHIIIKNSAFPILKKEAKHDTNWSPDINALYHYVNLTVQLPRHFYRNTPSILTLHVLSYIPSISNPMKIAFAFQGTVCWVGLGTTLEIVGKNRTQNGPVSYLCVTILPCIILTLFCDKLGLSDNVSLVSKHVGIFIRAYMFLIRPVTV